MTPPNWTLRIQNFRSLRSIEWSPQGVCLVAGPNGSGKTTLLQALRFLRTVYQRGFQKALDSEGGLRWRTRHTPESEAIVFELQLGDLVWRVETFYEGGGFIHHHGEKLTRETETVFEAKARSSQWIVGTETHTQDPSDRRCFLKILWDRDREAVDWLRPLNDFLNALISYKVFRPHEVVRPPDSTSDPYLIPPLGQNIWSTLHQWKLSPRRFQDQFQWVLQQASRAFPELIVDLEFDALPTPIPRLYPPDTENADDWIPIGLAADGLICGLLLLTAVAGAKEGSVLAFDEMENHLHPHAIRAILQAMREKAEERNLTIILTTHSPVVMNTFKGREDNFYILGSNHQTLPQPLNAAYDSEWLAHFSLGDLYDYEEIAAPRLSPSDPQSAPQKED